MIFLISIHINNCFLAFILLLLFYSLFIKEYLTNNKNEGINCK
jgi:hypothetical protein